MATEVQPDEKQPTDIVAKPTRIDRAKTALKDQRGHVGARFKDWLATGDIDDDEIMQLAANGSSARTRRRSPDSRAR
ncbi:hypothetical protein ACFQ51_52670 [Streptomyces kaempferi]